MAGVLNPRAIFGVKGNVRGNIAFVEESVCVYTAANHLVKGFTHPTPGAAGHSYSQEFMPCTTGTGGVTAMALSASRRYIAVAERNDSPEGAALAVYNVRTLTRRRIMYAHAHTHVPPGASPDATPYVVRASEFQGISFSVDDFMLACLAYTASPSACWSVVVYAIDRSKPIAAAAVAPMASGSVPITPLTHVPLPMSGLMAPPPGIVALPFSLSFSSVSLGKIALWGRNVFAFVSLDEAAPASSGTHTHAPAPAPAPADADAVASGVITLTHTLTALPSNHAWMTRMAQTYGRSAGEFTAHAWLQDDSSLLATATAEILLFKRDQFVRVLECSPLDNRVIDCLASYSRGFLAAGEGGLLRLFEYPDADDTQNFVCSKTFRVSASLCGADCEDRIRSLAISPTEDTVILAISGNQLVSFDLAHANVKDDASAFAPLGPASHTVSVGSGYGPGHRSDSCAILGMDVAVRKPLVATVGVDNTVRVWNYIDRTCEVSKLYPEGPTSVAFHPSGLHLLVGFSDKLRLLNILMDDIRDVKEFPIKSCPEVRFSRGGHLFAAVYGNVIQVYQTYTAQYMLTLRGHNGRVTSLNWAYNDATLLSCAADGTVYEWDLLDGKRSRDFTLKGIKWTCAMSTKDGAVVYAVGDGAGPEGTDFAVREIDMNMGTVLREFPLAQPHSALVYTMANPKMLFAVSSADGKAGVLRSYNMPLTSPATGVDYCAVSSAGVRLATSHDDSHLFVAGADGCMVVYEVRDRDGRLPQSDFGVKVAWSDEIMVTVSDLEDKKTAVRELREAVAELQSNNDYAMRMKDIAFQEQLKKITERYTTELEQERQQYDLLREEKLDMEREYTERLNAMEIAHRGEMQKRESLYQGKIMEEVERYQGLQSDVEAQRTMWMNKRNGMVTAHNQYMSQLTADYERKLEAARERRSEAEDELEGVKRDWEEMRRQMDDDLDAEIETMKRQFQEKLDAERDATLKFKGENGIMRKKFAALTKEIDENKEEIKRMIEKQKGLKAQIEALEKEISVLRTMIHEKDVAIAEKEKGIYELKKKNQELEKFKFVLDFKIKELKQQIEPRENEIQAMKNQIKNLDGELESFHKSNAEQDEFIGKLREQLDLLQARAAALRGSLIHKECSVKDFSAKLHDVIHSAKMPEELRAGMEELYAVHASSDLLATAADGAVITESDRQREHLASLVGELKRQSDDALVAHKHASARLIEENMGLIEQIKMLREQLAALRTAQKTLAFAVRTGVAAGTDAHTHALAAVHDDALAELHTAHAAAAASTGRKSLRAGTAGSTASAASGGPLIARPPSARLITTARSALHARPSMVSRE